MPTSRHTVLPIIAVALGACAPQSPPPPDASTTHTLTPLAPRSDPGNKLFETLDAATAGLAFVHQWSPRSAVEEALLKTGFTGGGVASGDYDGDGDADLILTSPQGGARLFKNTGGFTFEDVTESSGAAFTPPPGSLVAGSSFVDLNNDGNLDIFVNTYAWDDRLYLNNGDSTFSPAPPSIGLNHAGASVKTIFADIDRDGDLDAFTVTNRLEPTSPQEPKFTGTPGNYEPAPEFAELVSYTRKADGSQQFTKAGQFDHLYRNNLVETGSLSFTDISESAGITGADHGLDAVWWDYDHDGFPDLYVANDFTDPDRLYHNNQDGTFTETTRSALPHIPWFTMGAASADFDNDGLTDLLATDMAATTHFRSKVAMGSMDAVAWFLDSAEPRQYMKNALFLNSGTSRFREAAHLAGLASTDWTWSVKTADFDSDGHTDVYVTNGFTRDYMDSDFVGELEREGRAADPKAWEEAPELAETNLAFRNLGSLQFENTSADWSLDHHGVSFGSSVVDLDNDGDPDLVTNNFGSAPSLYRNNSQANHILKIAAPVGTHVTLTTANGDSQQKALHPGNGFMSADDPHLLFGLGQETVVTKLTATFPTGEALTLENIPADHLLTLVGSEAPQVPSPPVAPLYSRSDVFAGTTHSETEFDDFARQPLLPYRLSAQGPPLVFADIDSDGDPDAFLGGSAGFSAQLLLNPGDKTAFAPSKQQALDAAAPSEDAGALFFDADGDGDPDLLVTSGSNEFPPADPRYQDRLYLNDGSGNFTPGVALPVPPHPTRAAAAADIDADGDLDLFIGGLSRPAAYPVPSPSILLLNNGDATFVEAPFPELQKLGRISCALWLDPDSDSDPDLFVATDYGPVHFFENESGTLTEKTTSSGLAPYTGWWRSLAALDADSDGDLDLVAGNLGLNTKYHPTPDKPQLLFFGDFEKNTTAHIVEAKPGDTSLLPVRGLSCSSGAMPFIKRKLPTYHAFAAASLTDIYSPASLDSALRIEATTAESGIFINDGSAGFSFRPLPRIAQIAPITSIAVLDADGDGHQDLFLAENDFSPQRETGRHDGGLGQLLLGAGDGRYTPLRPDRSGIVVTGQATATIAVDLDSDSLPEIVTATHSGPVFVHSPIPQQKSKSESYNPLLNQALR